MEFVYVMINGSEWEDIVIYLTEKEAIESSITNPRSTLLNSKDELVREGFASDVQNAALWRALHHRVANRVQEVRLP